MGASSASTRGFGVRSLAVFYTFPPQKSRIKARIEIKGPYRDKRTRREKRGTSLSVSCPNMAEGRGNPRVGLSAKETVKVTVLGVIVRFFLSLLHYITARSSAQVVFLYIFRHISRKKSQL